MLKYSLSHRPGKVPRRVHVHPCRERSDSNLKGLLKTLEEGVDVCGLEQQVCNGPELMYREQSHALLHAYTGCSRPEKPSRLTTLLHPLQQTVHVVHSRSITVTKVVLELDTHGVQLEL